MTQHGFHTADRARWAVIVIAAMLLGGIPVGATAAPVRAAVADATISGSVNLPSDATRGSYYVRAYAHAADRGEWYPEAMTELNEDGSYTLEGLEAGRAYRIHFLNYDRRYTDGWYDGPGVPHAPSLEEGADVTAPAGAINFQLLEAVTIRGTYSLPEGFDWEPGGFEIVLDRLSSDGTWVRDMPFTTYKGRNFFSHVMRRPDSTYIIRVVDAPQNTGPARFPEGYVRVGTAGLVADSAYATRFQGNVSDIVVTIGRELVTPPAGAEPEPDPGAPGLEVRTMPELRGRAVVGEALETTPGAWSVDNTTTTYAWLRDGDLIAGAQSSTYTLTAADVGARIAARVTASAQGLAPVTVTTAPSDAVTAATAPRATKAPTLNGKARLGKTLRARPGTWDVPGVELSYQWLRNGKAIRGATSARYTLTKKDVRKRVSVLVTARKPGHADGASSSAAVKVAKGKAKVSAKVKNVKVGKRAKVKVRVKVAGLTKPRGTVIVKYGKKTIKAKLAAKRKGKLTVRLPKLAKGSYTIKVRYTPRGATKKFVTKGQSSRVTLRVR